MFENLKAFIRHGKQANELKMKPLEIGNPTLVDSGALDFLSLSNLPSLSDGLDNVSQYQQSPPPPEYQQQQKQQQQLADQHATYEQPQQVYQEPIIEVQPDVTEKSGAEQKQQNYGNYDAATQIVEQENLQKQKGKKYPNLDKYTILEQMGEGAFSVVYKAQNNTSGELVAIKILRKFQMDQAQKQSVLKEVTIMRQLLHENIVKFIEFIDSDQYYYIVQELAVGGEIFTAIVNYTYLSEDLSRHVIRQVGQAIRYLHEEVGIVHRDIKPENVLFKPIEVKPSSNPASKLRKSDDANTKRDEGEFIPGIGGGGIGTVQLADFGLSKQIWEHNTKTPCGTVGYTAPEIVRDERYSKEVDMWAIGCVLYTLLCGFPPFYDERIESLTEKVAKGEYTFLAPWWDEISPLAKNCVSKLLTVDPSKRYTIDDFLNDPWIQMGETEAGIAKDIVAPPKKVAAAPTQDFSQASRQSNVSTTQAARYSKKYMNSDLYSPAANALREAFDISAAVHRMGEEAALSNRFGGSNDIQALVEEEEEENEHEENSQGIILPQSNIPVTKRQAPRFQQKVAGGAGNMNSDMFDLNLGGASILERRKHKQVPVGI